MKSEIKNEMKNERTEVNLDPNQTRSSTEEDKGNEGNVNPCPRRRLVVSFRPGRRRQCKVTFGRLHRVVTDAAVTGLGCACAAAVLLCGCQVLTYSGPTGERFTRSS